MPLTESFNQSLASQTLRDFNKPSSKSELLGSPTARLQGLALFGSPSRSFVPIPDLKWGQAAGVWEVSCGLPLTHCIYPYVCCVTH